MRPLISLTLCGLLAACALHVPTWQDAQPQRTAPAAVAPDLPEIASGYANKPGWSIRRQAVAAAHPLAADAGYQILRAGGSAIDAAVAVQMVLGLVEPQSSGIGGGAFLMHWDGQRVEAFDGRETAPALADERLFLDPQGRPLSFHEAVVGARAVGVPGAVRMLELAHRRHGRLPWRDLITPAITLAETGFPVSARLHALLRSDPYLRLDPAAAAYFYQADGQPLPVGTRLHNPALAQVLRRIADEGSSALHEGEVARAIVQAVQSHPTRPGRLGLEDLRGYRAVQREALCHDWRPGTSMIQSASTPGNAGNTPRLDRGLKDETQGGPGSRPGSLPGWRVCGFPPPGSGALAIGQILGMLAHTPAAAETTRTAATAPAPALPHSRAPEDQAARRPAPVPSANWLHYYAEASRLALADRAQYVADPDFAPAPAGRWDSLLDPAYLAQRARLIGPRTMAQAPAGRPGGTDVGFAPMPWQPERGTSHISIVDGEGRAAALTSTIEDQFGARLMVRPAPSLAGGFLLNNQLTDFSFVPADAQGRPVANRVQAGKRPRSSMSPTLVFDRATGQLAATLGSPGGAMIIHFTAKTLVGTLDWGLDAQQAIDLPNFGVSGNTLLLEEGRFPGATAQALRDRGATVREQPMTSGVQAILRTPQGWFGGADPRREGIVRGD